MPGYGVLVKVDLSVVSKSVVGRGGDARAAHDTNAKDSRVSTGGGIHSNSLFNTCNTAESHSLR